jgi:prepilin-type N-terminal cleavage/methylation domain-containing protein/prepilin-type processing-associated H-X9-DG protein
MKTGLGRRRGGFSLIELLVVIAIVAVLASLLLPALSKAKARALSANCQSNLRQLSVLLRLYIDNEGFYPPWRLGGSPVGWQGAIGARAVSDTPTPPPWGKTTKHIARCPAAPKEDGMERLRPSYGYNAFDGVPEFNPWKDPPFGRGLGGVPQGPGGPIRQVPESGVANPADMYAIGDGFASTQWRQLMFGNGLIGRNLVVGGEALPELYAESAKAVRRHGGKLNVALCDGHVEAISVRNFLLSEEPGWKRRWHNQNTPD